ncbi:NACHT domain-containing protein [Bacillus sp. JRC01]|nr:NACHT domain-containing protein [Bacillus sp. JRC01]
MEELLTELVKNNVDKLINNVHKVGSDQYKKLKLKTGVAFEKYLTSGVEKYGYTKTILYRDKQVPIYDFFVNMDLECQEIKVNSANINDLLSKDKFITILASGGSGKSTLFKHFYMNAIRNTNLIPVFVELKSINDEEDMSLVDCIYKSLNDLKFDLEKDYFVQSLKSGRYLILLDGYDEVIDEKRQKLMKEIGHLTDKYDENHFILSSRHNNSFYNGWSKSTDFTLLPLDKDKAVKLIENLNYSPEVKNKFLKDLKEKIFDLHTSFCSNPLLLNLMLLTYEEFAEIPEKVHIFYGRAFEVLYVRHDGTKGLKRKLRTGEVLGYDEFVKVLSFVSILSYLDAKVSFDTEELKGYIGKAAQTLSKLDLDADDYITDLVESICILHLDGLKYNFQHRSFQEFFTAKFILNLPDKQLLDVISKLIEKRYSSISSDGVLDLIFEMDRQKFEKVFLIPKLNEIKNYTKESTDEKTFHRFLSSAFRAYGIDPSLIAGNDNSTLEDCVVFTQATKREKKYYLELVYFLISKYQDIYPYSSQAILYRNLDVIRKYGYPEERGLYINIDSVTPNNTELMNDFLLHSSHFIDVYKQSMMILNQLEDEHKEKDNILNDLFDLNKL